MAVTHVPRVEHPECHVEGLYGHERCRPSEAEPAIMDNMMQGSFDGLRPRWTPCPTYIPAGDLSAHARRTVPSAAADNPHNAWYVEERRSRARPEGKLKGKTVALKDNVCLAGVPMMNGASSDRRLRPQSSTPPS